MIYLVGSRGAQGDLINVLSRGLDSSERTDESVETQLSAQKILTASSTGANPLLAAY